MIIHLLGATTSTGQAFITSMSNRNDVRLRIYKRSPSGGTYNDGIIDLNNPSMCQFNCSGGSNNILVSFAPIWLVSKLISYLSRELPNELRKMQGVIVCSSSSTLTKRFAFTKHSSDLAYKLFASEQTIVDCCKSFNLPCQILRPTLIYGSSGTHHDKNISVLLRLLRLLPLLLIPSDTGLRQPLHCRQLAEVAIFFARKMVDSDATIFNKKDILKSDILTFGGDEILSYKDMILAIQSSRPVGDCSRNCLLVPVSNRLFFALVAPLAIISPSIFEALLRMCANLGNFTRVCDIMGTEPNKFPLADN